MKWGYGSMTAGVAAVLFGAAAFADVVGTHKVFLPRDIPWAPAPAAFPAGAEAAVLLGDPTKEGPFVVRIRAPEGYRISPHTHPKPEALTIISGEISLGLGPAADRATTKKLPAGSFSVMPAGVVHYVFADQEAVVQIDAIGPWGMDYIDPKDDPRLQIAPAQR